VASPRDVDVLVAGVWVPVLRLLAEKYPGMFSVGIANTLARCYQSVQSFASSLCTLAGKGDLLLARRMHGHTATREFYDKWRLTMYLQVRL
jgi:hypothetical protein